MNLRLGQPNDDRRSEVNEHHRNTAIALPVKRHSSVIHHHSCYMKRSAILRRAAKTNCLRITEGRLSRLTFSWGPFPHIRMIDELPINYIDVFLSQYEISLAVLRFQ